MIERLRRIRRLLVRVLAIALGLAVLLRIALPYMLPAILGEPADGWKMQWEDLSLSLTGGSVTLRHVEIGETSSDDRIDRDRRLLEVEYLNLEISTLALLTGDIEIQRVEIDGAEAHLRRAVDGTWNFESLAGDGGEEDDEDEEEPETGPRDPIDTDLGLKILAARVQHVRIHVTDESVDPPIDTWLDATARISNVGDVGRDGRASLTILGRNLDIAHIDADWQTPGTDLMFRSRLTVEGLKPSGLEPWLRPLGIEHETATALAAGLRFEADLTASKGPGHALSARLIDGFVSVDNDEIMGFDRVEAEIEDLRSGAGLIRRVAIERPRGMARIDPDGSFAIGSIRMVPTGVAGDESLGESPNGEEAGTEAPAPIAGAEDSDSGPALWVIDRLAIHEAAFDFTDLSSSPPARLAARDLEVEILELGTGAESNLRLDGNLPGVSEDISIRGTAQLAGETLGCGLDVSLAGLTLSELEPWLQASGVSCRLAGASLDLAIEARARQTGSATEASLSVRDLELVDGQGTDPVSLLALRELAIDRLRLTEDLTSVDGVALRGLHTDAERLPDGSLAILGFVLGAAPENESVPEEAPVMTPEPTGPGARPTPRGPERIRLDRLDLEDIALTFVDRSVTPQFEIAPLRIDGHVDDLLIDHENAKGAWQLALSTGGTLFDRFDVTGKIRQRAQDRILTTGFSSAGLEFASAAGYLRPLGLEPVLEDGELSGRLTWTERLGEDRSADLALDDLRLRHGETELLSSPTILVRRMDDRGIRRILIENLRTSVHRLADGRIETLGLRTVLEQSADDPQQGRRPTDREPVGGADRTPAGSPRVDPAVVDPTVAVAETAGDGSFTIDLVRLENATVDFRDDTIQPPLETELRLRLRGEELEDGLPRTLDLGLEIPELLESASILAGFEDGGNRISADLAIEHPTARVESYLPPGIRLMDEQIEFRMGLVCELGDPVIGLAIENLELVSPSAPSPWIRIPTARFEGRFEGRDATDIVVEIPAIEARARQNGEVLEVAALQIEPVDSPEVELPEPAPPEPDSAEETKPGRPPESGSADPAATDTDPAATDTGPVAASQLSTRSRLHVERIDIGFADLEWVDREAEVPTPLQATLRLRNTKPFRFGFEDDDETSDAPLELQIEGRVARVLDRLEVDLHAELAALEPVVDLEWRIDGLDGPELTRALPSLQRSIDASKLTDGSFSGRTHLLLHTQRDPAGLPDFAQEFGFDLQVQDVLLTRSPDAAPAFELADFELLTRRISPTGAILIDSVDVSGLRASAEQTEAGLLFAGVTFLAAPEDDTPSGATTVDGRYTGEVEVGAVDDSGTVVGAGATTPFELDRLSVQNSSLEFADSTGPERVRLPIAQIELDLEGLRWPENAAPARFSAYLEAGDSELPVPEPQESVFGGILSSASQLVLSRKDRGTEVRPLFESISATGQLSLTDEPRGRFRIDVSELEMLALAPFARTADIDIRSGRFSSRIDIDVRGSNGVDVGSQLVFRDLGLTDNSNAISSYLGLGVPINTVLFALRDSSGAQVIPLSFTLDPKGGISGGEITTAVSTALASVLGNAAASAGFRVASPLTDLVPFGGGETAAPLETLDLDFPAGAIDWIEAADTKLEQAVAFLQENKGSVLVLEHELSAGDQERARALANPDADRLASIVARMRQRRLVLRAERLEAIPEARRLYSSGRRTEAEKARQTIQLLDQEIGQIEEALDNLLRLLRPGAERRADRRSRTAATEIARLRLDRVRETLLRRLGPGFEDRIDSKSGRGDVVEDLELGTVRIRRRFRAGR